MKPPNEVMGLFFLRKRYFLRLINDWGQLEYAPLEATLKNFYHQTDKKELSTEGYIFYFYFA